MAYLKKTYTSLDFTILTKNPRDKENSSLFMNTVAFCRTERRGYKTRQILESEKPRVYAQKHRLKMPFKNSISGCNVENLGVVETSKRAKYGPDLFSLVFAMLEVWAYKIGTVPVFVVTSTVSEMAHTSNTQFSRCGMRILEAQNATKQKIKKKENKAIYSSESNCSASPGGSKNCTSYRTYLMTKVNFSCYIH